MGESDCEGNGGETTMRALIGMLACVVAAFAPLARAQEAPPPLDRTAVAAFMSGVVREAMSDHRIVGASVAVVDAQGVVFARGFGQAGPDRAADADTLFRIASISKTFTWIAIQQLVEAGALSLDDPINDHLPQALHIPDDGFADPILVRHLMTHAAGFEDSTLGHLFVDAPERVTPLQTYLARYRVRRVRPPGTLAVYSNYGAALAGAIVEHESGQDWQTYAEARILRPLGMNASTFRERYAPELAGASGLPAPASEDIVARISEGYRLVGGRMEAAPFEYIVQIAPAGGMSASASDMAQYMLALLSSSRMAESGVLSAESALSLREPIFTNDERLGAWRHGFMTYDLGGGRWAFGHGGDTIYQHSELVVSPDLGFGLFVTINTAAPLSRAPASFVEAFVAEFYPSDAAPTRAEVSTEESARYAGTYLGLRRPFHHSERALFRVIGETQVAAAEDGDLVIAGGGGAYRFMPLGDGLYQRVDGDRRIAFREVDGAMRLFDPWSAGPADRIGFFQSSAWLSIAACLGGLLALWGVVAGIRRMIGGRESLAALAFDVLCLVWLAALGLLGLSLAPWLVPDQGVVIFGYPGDLFPIACWALAGAAASTPLALIAGIAARPAGWGWLRWLRAGACVAAFAALTATLWDFGFLGFSSF